MAGQVNYQQQQLPTTPDMVAPATMSELFFRGTATMSELFFWENSPTATMSELFFAYFPLKLAKNSENKGKVPPCRNYFLAFSPILSENQPNWALFPLFPTCGGPLMTDF